MAKIAIYATYKFRKTKFYNLSVSFSYLMIVFETRSSLIVVCFSGMFHIASGSRPPSIIAGFPYFPDNELSIIS